MTFQIDSINDGEFLVSFSVQNSLADYLGWGGHELYENNNSYKNFVDDYFGLDWVEKLSH